MIIVNNSLFIRYVKYVVNVNRQWRCSTESHKQISVNTTWITLKHVNTDGEFTCIKYTRTQIFHLRVHADSVFTYALINVFSRDRWCRRTFDGFRTESNQTLNRQKQSIGNGAFSNSTTIALAFTHQIVFNAITRKRYDLFHWASFPRHPHRVFIFPLPVCGHRTFTKTDDTYIPPWRHTQNALPHLSPTPCFTRRAFAFLALRHSFSDVSSYVVCRQFQIRFSRSPSFVLSFWRPFNVFFPVARHRQRYRRKYNRCTEPHSSCIQNNNFTNHIGNRLRLDQLSRLHFVTSWASAFRCRHIRRIACLPPVLQCSLLLKMNKNHF